jgi:hypothetical protein
MINERQNASRSHFLDYLGRKLVSESDADYETCQDRDLLYGVAGPWDSEEGETGVICIVRVKDGFLSNRLDSNGELLPAVETANGHTEWWEAGLLHRRDGPAVFSDGGAWQEWWEEGRLLRIEEAQEDAETSL